MSRGRHLAGNVDAGRHIDQSKACRRPSSAEKGTRATLGDHAQNKPIGGLPLYSPLDCTSGSYRGSNLLHHRLICLVVYID
jgi:hypothetical protein